MQESEMQETTGGRMSKGVIKKKELLDIQKEISPQEDRWLFPAEAGSRHDLRPRRPCSSLVPALLGLFRAQMLHL